MKAVVFHEIGDIRLDDRPEPQIKEPLTSAIDAYRAFDERQPGWIKVELRPSRVSVKTA